MLMMTRLMVVRVKATLIKSKFVTRPNWIAIHSCAAPEHQIDGRVAADPPIVTNMISSSSLSVFPYHSVAVVPDDDP